MFVLLSVKNNIKTEIARCSTLEKCFVKITERLNDIGFKSYYQRYRYINDSKELTIDYGSHIAFFEIIKTSGNGREDFEKEYRDYVSEHTETSEHSYKTHNHDIEKQKLMKELIDRYEQLKAVKDKEMHKLLEEYIHKLERKLKELL